MSRLVYLAWYAILSFASATKFTVVGFPPDGLDLAVKVGSEITPLAVNVDGTLWSGDAVARVGARYNYVIIDESGSVVEAEKFHRILLTSAESATPNEVFNRRLTVAEIPPLPQVYDAWPYGNVDAIFNPSYIPTIHIIMQGVVEDDIYVAAADKGATVDVVFVGQHQVFRKKNANFRISGLSSLAFRKQQLALTFTETDSLEGRQHFKLRAGCFDPSFLRERVYTDVVNSLGIPVQQGTFVRLYVNKKFFGLYFMIDDLDTAWARDVVADGKTPQTLIEMHSIDAADHEDSVGNLVYRGPSSSLYIGTGYKVKYPGTNPPGNPMADCIYLMKQLHDFDPETASESEIEALQSAINFDFLYRHAALEFLSLHWDGSWHSASNFYFTKTNDGKWFVSPTDFDLTFGSLPNEVNGKINARYEDWILPVYPMSDVKPDRPLFEKTLAVPVLRAKFEGILKTIVQKVFHPAALIPRLTAVHDFIRDDVADDRDPAVFDPPKEGAGTDDYGWTLAHFDILHMDGDEDGTLECRKWDCEYGIISFVRERAEVVAQQLGFTFEDIHNASGRPEPHGNKVDDFQVEDQMDESLARFHSDMENNSPTIGLAPPAAIAGLVTFIVAIFVHA